MHPGWPGTASKEAVDRAGASEAVHHPSESSSDQPVSASSRASSPIVGADRKRALQGEEQQQQQEQAFARKEEQDRRGGKAQHSRARAGRGRQLAWPGRAGPSTTRCNVDDVCSRSSANLIPDASSSVLDRRAAQQQQQQQRASGRRANKAAVACRLNRSPCLVRPAKAPTPTGSQPPRHAAVLLLLGQPGASERAGARPTSAHRCRPNSRPLGSALSTGRANGASDAGQQAPAARAGSPPPLARPRPLHASADPSLQEGASVRRQGPISGRRLDPSWLAFFPTTASPAFPPLRLHRLRHLPSLTKAYPPQHPRRTLRRPTPPPLAKTMSDPTYHLRKVETDNTSFMKGAAPPPKRSYTKSSVANSHARVLAEIRSDAPDPPKSIENFRTCTAPFSPSSARFYISD